MPNWCENNVGIFTTVEYKKELDDFYNKSTDDGGGFDLLNRHLPIPKPLLEYISPNPDKAIADEMVKLYGYPDWYSWSDANWGTKWNPDINSVDYDQVEYDYLNGLHIHLNFDSAWSPPIAGLLNLSKLYPKLIFFIKYEESGMGFAGYFECMNGNVISEQKTEMLWHDSFYGYYESLEKKTLDSYFVEYAGVVPPISDGDDVGV